MGQPMSDSEANTRGRIMRVVLDTCVLVAASRSRQGASNALLRLLPHPRFQVAAGCRYIVTHHVRDFRRTEK